MKIALSQITEHGLNLDFQLPANGLKILKELVDDGEVTAFSPLAVSVTLWAREGYIDVRGQVVTEAILTCSRCLAEFSYLLEQHFSVRFSQEIPQDLSSTSSDDDADIELTADQVGLVFFEGDELDLREVIQEQIALGLPYKPLCREDCKGLCAKCGADLNQASCKCGNNGSGSPFDVLKNFKFE